MLLTMKRPTKDETAAVVRLVDEAIAYHTWQNDDNKANLLSGWRDKYMDALARIAVKEGI